jgi:hypothetical protein
MRTALDAPPEKLDESERSFIDCIRKHGWFDMHVAGDKEGPGFSYTTGFWLGVRHPELIIFGTKNDTAHSIFWDAFRDVKEGTRLATGGRIDGLFGNHPAYAFRVAERHYGEYLGWSRWFYGGDDFPCLQIVWPDRSSRFPWQRGYDPAFVGDQPDLSDKGWLNSLVH